MHIRCAREDDAREFLRIYAYYVVHTAVTFDWETPGEEEFRKKIRQTLKRYPFLAAEEDGEILGYAYAGPFKDRAAYDWSVETSIYVSKDQQGKGIGRALYQALEERLTAQGIQNAYACISYTDTEDETLTNASMRFHRRMGYQLCGTFRKCGYKFGRWYDMIWMEKMLGDHGVPKEIR